MKEQLTISYQRLPDSSQSDEDKSLLAEAEKATQMAYAPYSRFHVGCAFLLDDGTVVRSANQENAAYPQCVCAEVSGVNTVAMAHPGKIIKRIFITSNPPLSQVLGPCGQCRQTLLEYERRQNQAIEIGLASGSDLFLFSSVQDLLPFAF